MSVATQLARLLLPPARCVLCGDVALRANLCAGCMTELPLLGHACPLCARPFTRDSPASSGTCGRCRLDPPPWHAARCALNYRFPLDHLLQQLKFGRRLDIAPALGECVALALAAHAPVGTDALVPVPLHWRRRWSRGFNQAHELALPVARRAGLPIRDALLRRHRATPPQSRLAQDDRRSLPARTFVANEAVRGLRLILFDDVLTSGATAAAATHALCRAGAASVTLWCCARAWHT